MTRIRRNWVIAEIDGCCYGSIARNEVQYRVRGVRPANGGIGGGDGYGLGHKGFCVNRTVRATENEGVEDGLFPHRIKIVTEVGHVGFQCVSEGALIPCW